MDTVLHAKHMRDIDHIIGKQCLNNVNILAFYNTKPLEGATNGDTYDLLYQFNSIILYISLYRTFK